MSEFAAAASNEGALGSIGSLFRTSAAIRRDIDVVKELTNRNFAVNHIPPALDADAFRHTLAARPAVISFALGDPGDLVRQAHDVGSKVMVQVTTVAQAIEAAERGADVIIAQGGEAGGYGGIVSTMALVPQVVDVVSPILVVAAGGSLTDAALCKPQGLPRAFNLPVCTRARNHIFTPSDSGGMELPEQSGQIKDTLIFVSTDNGPC